MEAVEQVVNLFSSKHGEKGEVRLRLVFQPKIVAKTRKQTSTFIGAGRAMTQIGTNIGAIPLSAGKGVFHGVTGVFKHKEHEETIPEDDSGEKLQAANNHVAVAAATLPSENGQSPPGEPGTLRVSVMDAKGLVPHDMKAYATVRVGDKEFKTKHTGKTDAPEWLVILYLKSFFFSDLHLLLIGMRLSLSLFLPRHLKSLFRFMITRLSGKIRR